MHALKVARVEVRVANTLLVEHENCLVIRWVPTPNAFRVTYNIMNERYLSRSLESPEKASENWKLSIALFAIMEPINYGCELGDVTGTNASTSRPVRCAGANQHVFSCSLYRKWRSQKTLGTPSAKEICLFSWSKGWPVRLAGLAQSSFFNLNFRHLIMF